MVTRSLTVAARTNLLLLGPLAMLHQPLAFFLVLFGTLSVSKLLIHFRKLEMGERAVRSDRQGVFQSGERLTGLAR